MQRIRARPQLHAAPARSEARRAWAVGAVLVLVLALDFSRDRGDELEAPRRIPVTHPVADVPDTPEARLRAAAALLDAGRVQDAEATARQLYETSAGAPAAQVAGVLDLWVECLWRARRLEGGATLALAHRAVDLNAQLYGTDSAPVAASLLNLAIVQRIAHQLEAARATCARALAVLERANRSGTALGARVVAEQGTIDFMAGDYAGAIERLEGALRLHDAAADARRTDAAAILNALGASYGRASEFARARAAHEKALAIRVDALGAEHPTTAESYNNLGVLLSQMGDLQASLDMRERVVQIRTLHYGARASLTLQAMSNLALMLRRTGRYEAARSLYAYVLDELDPERIADRAAVLAGLGRLEQVSGNLEAATTHYRQALDARVALHGPNHHRVAGVLASLAALHYQRGVYGEAESLCRRALEIRVRARRVNQPAMAEDMVLLAEILAAQGLDDAAFEFARRAEALAAAHLAETARGLSRHEALRYAEVRTRGSDLLIRLATAPADDPTRRTDAVERLRGAWDALVRSRALVFEEMGGRLRSASLDSATAAARQRWQAAIEAHATLAFVSDGSEPSQRRDALRRAQRELEAAERAFAAANRPEPAAGRSSDTGLDDVEGALPPGAALVAYSVHGIDHDAADEASTFWLADAYPRGRELVAWVLRQGQPPRAVALGAMCDVDPLVATWAAEAAFGVSARGRSAGQAEQAYRQAGTALRRAIWDPLQPLVGTATNIFIVADASLHLVTHAALPLGETRYLADSLHRFHYVDAERDIVRTAVHATDGSDARGHADRSAAMHTNPSDITSTAATSVGHGLLALGGADFDVRDDRTASLAHAGVRAAPGDVDEHLALRGGRTSCPELESLRFEPLPSTLAEVHEVERLWHEATARRDGSRDARADAAPTLDSIVLTGAAATDDAFIRLASGRRILHLATHGFFLGNGCSAAPGTRGIRSRSAAARELPDNPFVQSGLALAGANRRSSAHARDGILTAEEISVLDLRGVEWAVLSACETGRGEVQVGEGVLGLRRAFRTAGVRTVIMSLWAVADEPTREWMQALYAARLVEGVSTLEAVHRASTRTLQARRARGASTHPFYWGGFVAAGDWN